MNDGWIEPKSEGARQGGEMNHQFHANAWERKIIELETDIERLKVELELSGSSETRLEAEIERLRAELDKAHRLCGQMIGWQRDAEIAKAKLRAALEELREWTDSEGPWHAIIDKALQKGE